MALTNTQRWAELLTVWEQQVSQARASLDTPGGVPADFRWDPPTDLGPLPTDLASRALELCRSLQDLSNRSAQAMDELRRQRRAVDHLAKNSGSQSSPVYLNVDS